MWVLYTLVFFLDKMYMMWAHIYFNSQRQHKTEPVLNVCERAIYFAYIIHTQNLILMLLPLCFEYIYIIIIAYEMLASASCFWCWCRQVGGNSSFFWWQCNVLLLNVYLTLLLARVVCTFECICVVLRPITRRELMCKYSLQTAA